MSKSFFERFSPRSLGRGLWGKGSMPTHWKVLFTAQTMIFTLALWVRTVDVENMQKLKRLEAEKKSKEEGGGDGDVGVESDESSTPSLGSDRTSQPSVDG
mmetsp:Transcript_12709/g.27839  ORF Transcript_12709/g.27839 Transcript_12709/m.27839 type:complete len:100 (-) Transcript_12709:1553-1852(-)